MAKEKVHENCIGCKHVTGQEECDAYIKPSIFWRHGRTCTLASHHTLTSDTEKKGKTRVGQQKQKKVK